MKPRNDKEHKIMLLSKTLPGLTERQLKWAKEHCFPKYATGVRSRWCSECGQPVSINKSGNSVACPRCGAKLKPMDSRRITHNEKTYYTVITTCRGYQVCRHFVLDKKTRKHCEAQVECHEVVQKWIDSKGNETIVARPVSCCSYVYDSWVYDAPMSIKRNSVRYSYLPDMYVYPYVRTTPLIRRNGFSRCLQGFAHSELFKMLLRDAEAETLLKTGQISLLKYKYRHNIGTLRYQHSIRIATKHGYEVNDASMWLDYLELLEFFGRDTHNPHYICPSDLKSEHDRLVEKKQKIKKSSEIKKYEAEYSKAKSRFFGICFGDDDITVSVIGSVREMEEEGSAMHHCVFTNQYFLKPYSLILTARDKSGKRIETVEVNLKTFQVVQSRGVCNQTTEYHSQILKLVRDNINLIKQAA